MIHETAIIHQGAELDSDVQVGPWCTIGPNVKIKRGTILKSHVVVTGCTEIGEGNILYPFSCVGEIPQDLKYKGEPTKLFIGDHNQIREGVTIHPGTVQGGGETRVGDRNLLMGYVHIGHDCMIGSQTILANYVGLAGHVTIDDFANVGGMVGISQFTRLGAYSYVTGQSGIEKDVIPYAVISGSRPSLIRGANIVGLRRHGFSAETIQKINEAIKLWNRPDVQKEQCLYEIEAQYGEVAEIQHLMKFIKESKGGAIKPLS